MRMRKVPHWLARIGESISSGGFHVERTDAEAPKGKASWLERIGAAMSNGGFVIEDEKPKT